MFERIKYPQLARLFALKVAYQYPGGIGEAVQELMKQAITE
jgi:hypothetical protein